MTNSLKAISPKALRVFKVLINGLVEVGIDRKFNNAPGIFLPLTVELIRVVPGQFLLVSLCHYVLSNDDLVCDPKVIYMVTADGNVYPISFENSLVFSQAVRMNADGAIISIDAPKQRELASFSNMWLQNIAEQQGI